MASEFRPIIIGMLLAGLFTIAMLSASISFSALNNVPQSLGSDPILSNLNANITDYYETIPDTTNQTSGVLESSTITTTFVIILDSIGGIWKTMKVMPITTYNLLSNVIFPTLLGSQGTAIIIGIVGSLFLITIIFAVWKWLNSAEGG